MLSTKMMPLLTTFPDTIINPRRTTTLNGVPVTHSVKTTPITPSGTVNMMMNGCQNDSNSDAMIM